MDTDPNLFIGLARSLKYTIELLLAEEVPENLSMTGLHSIILKIITHMKYFFSLIGPKQTQKITFQKYTGCRICPE